MKAILNSKYLILFAGILIFFQLLIVFSVVNYTCFFNSDTFYLPSLYQDLFYGYGLEGWQFNPAPNFFPDMISYFILSFFSGGDFVLTAFVFAVIQYFVIILLLYKLFKKVFDSDDFNRNYVIGSLLTSLFLMVCVVNNNFYSAFQLVSNSYHLGAFINALLAFLITINYVKNKKKSTAYWLIFLIILASFSDRLFIVQYVVVVIFLLFFRSAKEKKISLIRMSIVFFSACISIVIFKLIRVGDYINFNTAPSRTTLEFIKDSISVFIAQLHSMMASSIIELVIVLVSFTSYILVLIFLIINRKNKSYAMLGVFFFLSFTLFAPIFSGLYQGIDSIRYNITFYLVALFVLPYMLDLFKVKQWLNNGFSVFIPVVFAVVILFQFDKLKGLEEYFNHKNTYAETLDELKETHGLKNGVATYWSAKKNMIYSKNGVRVYSVFQDLNVYTHVTNRRWFREEINGDKAVFNFVIIDKEETLETVKNTFTNYEVIEKGEVKICVTPDFVYPEGQNHLEIVTPLYLKQ